MVQLNVDVIVTANDAAGRAAQQATKSVPIVIAIIGDPVGSGFVATLARPGGNITGLSIQSPDLTAKRLQLLKEAVPNVSRVALLADTLKGEGPDEVIHVAAPGSALPEPGTQLVAELDWERRHRLMRMHTCLHLLRPFERTERRVIEADSAERLLPPSA